MHFYHKFGKRIIDLLLSFFALVLLSPLLLILSLAVLISSGRPVFFIQDRVGLLGSIFPCYKFRTMKTGTTVAFNSDGSTQVRVDDTRVTGIGHFLRKYSLDELPQLFNVLHGQMSLVGPRPDLPLHWNQYTPSQRRRYNVKPGITGLAQVNGRNSLDIAKKISYDLEYIQTYSLYLDIIILLQTVGVVLKKTDVHSGPSN